MKLSSRQTSGGRWTGYASWIAKRNQSRPLSSASSATRRTGTRATEVGCGHGRGDANVLELRTFFFDFALNALPFSFAGPLPAAKQLSLVAASDTPSTPKLTCSCRAYVILVETAGSRNRGCQLRRPYFYSGGGRTGDVSNSIITG